MADLPLLLALDTSTRSIGLALYDGTQVLCEWMWVSKDFHTVELAPAVAEMLEKCKFQVENLNALAVATGPGSFTGIRIGLALAKGLALACHIPLVGIPTMDIVAYAQPPRPTLLVVALRAGRSRLAIGWYQYNNGWQPENGLEVLTAGTLAERIHEPVVICGELDATERQLLLKYDRGISLATPAESLRRASFLAELGWQHWHAGQVSDPATLAPIYLHYNQPVEGGKYVV